MNDKEMIEEMAKDIEMVEKEAFSKIAKETQLYVKENHRYNSKEDYFLAHTKTIYELVAEAFIKLGYRKIKDTDLYILEENIEEFGNFIATSPQTKQTMEQLIKAWQKETAKEILQSLLDFVTCEKFNQDNAFEKIKEALIKVAKAYDVEVEE